MGEIRIPDNAILMWRLSPHDDGKYSEIVPGILLLLKRKKRILRLHFACGSVDQGTMIRKWRIKPTLDSCGLILRPAPRNATATHHNFRVVNGVWTLIEREIVINLQQ